jgi:hypothetical protein
MTPSMMLATSSQTVGGGLEALVDLLPLDDVDRIVLVLLEEARHRAAQDRVRLVLQPVDVDAELQHLLRVLESRSILATAWATSMVARMQHVGQIAHVARSSR